MPPRPKISTSQLVSAVKIHKAHGPGPTIRELAKELGTSTQAVNTALRHAEHEGKITRVPTVARGIFIQKEDDEM
jgi:DNA-binding transcriptional regulator YhcF (GntR family)